MDCQFLELPEWLTCNFRRLWTGIYGKEDAKREIHDIINQWRHRLVTRVEWLLRDNEGKIDESIDDFNRRRDELRAMIASCDEKCLRDYIQKYFEKKMKKQSANSEKAQDFLEWELREYFQRHPEIEQEIKKWYTLYNDGNPKKSELLRLLPPVLASIERRTWAHIGFIPMRWGFISILRKPDGSYYAVRGETISSGKTLESAIAPFANETTQLQIIDTSGKVIGSVETPLSRSLDALLFIDRHHSVWSMLTGDKGKAIDISYHQDGHKIHLRTPREWFQVEYSHGEESLRGIGNVTGNRFALGYNFTTWFSESTLTLGKWTLRGENFLVEGTQIRLANHVHFWEIPFRTSAIGLHGIGMWDAKVQGAIKKPDTAKLEGRQALALSWERFYLWYGRSVRWTPDLIEKKYGAFSKSPLIIAWVKSGNMALDASMTNGWVGLNLRGSRKNSSLEATIDYQKRTHALLGNRSIRGQVSYVEQF